MNNRNLRRRGGHNDPAAQAAEDYAEVLRRREAEDFRREEDRVQTLLEQLRGQTNEKRSLG